MFLFVVLLSESVMSQIINKDKMKLANYVERLYRNGFFTGVKLIDDDTAKYLISVVVLDPVKFKGRENAMLRISSVKSSSQVSRYFNGSMISENLIIHTSEKSDGTTDVETLEIIREKSVGFVNGLELLTNFEDVEGQMVYVYMKVI